MRDAPGPTGLDGSIVWSHVELSPGYALAASHGLRHSLNGLWSARIHSPFLHAFFPGEPPDFTGGEGNQLLVLDIGEGHWATRAFPIRRGANLFGSVVYLVTIHQYYRSSEVLEVVELLFALFSCGYSIFCQSLPSSSQLRLVEQVCSVVHRV